MIGYALVDGIADGMGFALGCALLAMVALEIGARVVSRDVTG